MSIRVAIIGCGYFAQFHHRAWARIETAKVTAICDQAPERMELWRALHPDARCYTSAAAMLEGGGADLIDIVTPPASHRALVALAADAGIDAICQKPLAPTFAEAAAIVELAERAGIRLIVHENFRHMPWHREMRRLIEAGQFGRLHGMTVRVRPGDGQGPDAYRARQPYFQQMPRFFVHETGVHWIDTFRMLLGEVSGVFARLRRRNPAILGEDAGCLLFDFDSGATGLMDVNRLNDHSAANTRLTMGEAWLEGEAGVLRLDGDGALWWKPHGGIERPHLYRWQDRDFAGDSVHATQGAILDSIAAGRPAPGEARAYLRNLAIVEAAYRSAATGMWVATPTG